MSQPAGESNATIQRFSGGVLMAIGGLIVFLCGSCTAFFLGTAIWDAVVGATRKGLLTESERYGAAWAPIIGVGAILVGGLPTAFGGVLLFNGIRMSRRPKPPLPPAVDDAIP